MTSLLPPSTAAGPWRVNIDVRHGSPTGRPESDPHELVDYLLGRGVPLAVIDLDRSIDRRSSSVLLEQIAARQPGKIWLGGRLAPAGSLVPRLFDAGAAGVIIGCSEIFRNGEIAPAEIAALSRFPRPEQLMVSVDAVGDRLAVDGFATVTTIHVVDALARVAEATGGQTQIIYTDVAAAQRRSLVSWPRLRALARSFTSVPLWYAGGLQDWAALRHVWGAGLGGVVGRAYFGSPLGLSEHAGP